MIQGPAPDLKDEKLVSPKPLEKMKGSLEQRKKKLGLLGKTKEKVRKGIRKVREVCHW